MIIAIEAPKQKIVEAVQKALASMDKLEPSLQSQSQIVLAATSKEAVARAVGVIKDYLGETDDEWIFIRPGAELHKTEAVKKWEATGLQIPEPDEGIPVT